MCSGKGCMDCDIPGWLWMLYDSVANLVPRGKEFPFCMALAYSSSTLSPPKHSRVAVTMYCTMPSDHYEVAYSGISNPDFQVANYMERPKSDNYRPDG